MFLSNDEDVKMDISNNYYGRKKGTELKYYSDSYIGTNIVNNVSNGNLKRIRTYTSKRCTSNNKGDDVCTKYVGYMLKKIVIIVIIFLVGYITSSIVDIATKPEPQKQIYNIVYSCMEDLPDATYEECYPLAADQYLTELELENNR